MTEVPSTTNPVPASIKFQIASDQHLEVDYSKYQICQAALQTYPAIARRGKRMIRLSFELILWLIAFSVVEALT